MQPFRLERDYAGRLEGLPMAETSKGKKFVKVKPYTRVVDGKKIKVGAFDRSTPKTSKGTKK